MKYFWGLWIFIGFGLGLFAHWSVTKPPYTINKIDFIYPMPKVGDNWYNGEALINRDYWNDNSNYNDDMRWEERHYPWPSKWQEV